MHATLDHLQECFSEWLQIHDFDYDYWFYTPAEWRARGEKYLRDSKLVFAADNQLIALMSVGSGFEDELQELAEGFGYYFEFGEQWNFGFYPCEDQPSLPAAGLSYSRLLRDARWQKKRRRITERSGGKCEDCGEKARDVHHCYYRFGRLPWQYPNGALLHLCSDCHTRRAKTEIKFRGFLPRLRSAELLTLRTALDKGLYWYPRREFFEFISHIGYEHEKCRSALDALLPLRSHLDERESRIEGTDA